MRFKLELVEIRREITGVDIEVDDGRDDGDEVQNARYSLSYNKLTELRRALAYIDVPGVDVEQVWRESWPPNKQTQLMEDRYTHAVTYIDRVLALLGGDRDAD